MQNKIWILKIALKIILSRIPMGYRFWSNIGIFLHGKMKTRDYPKMVLELHFSEFVDFGGHTEGSHVLEIGTGDSVASCLIANKWGSKVCYTVDAGDYASKDMNFYQTLSMDLGKILKNGTTFEEMLNGINGIQLTQGLNSWSAVPRKSIDFVWSHSTLEHIRKREFDATLANMFEVMKPGALCSHNIDLKDHLGGALNNLRFSEKLWEAEWWVRSGFYTNRLRPSEILERFETAGFEMLKVEIANREQMPMPCRAMAPRFRTLADDDLLATGMHIVSRRPA